MDNNSYTIVMKWTGVPSRLYSQFSLKPSIPVTDSGFHLVKRNEMIIFKLLAQLCLLQRVSFLQVDFKNLLISKTTLFTMFTLAVMFLEFFLNSPFSGM